MPIADISNGRILEINEERNTMFVTVLAREGEGRNNRDMERTVVLVVGPRTLIFAENGMPLPARALRVGMIIDATISSAMTRSNPPQANAYIIRIVRRGQQESVTTGRILNVDRSGSNFTIMRGQNRNNIIRFNVNGNTRILGRNGRPMPFSRLMPGMQVRVRHADFMTASIPPQTTAFEVRVL